MRVEIDSGWLEGSVGDDVTRFLGVPFAEASVGRLRFQRPQRMPRWQGDRSAVGYAPGPPQEKTVGVGVRGATRSAEDCLYLNVFSSTRSSRRRAVLVWIYGGGYLHGDAGDALFDGSNLARAQDLVVVTFNYRLGVWGFAPLVERNVGLADQIAALEWVARNIAVTIAGESSGAMSVCNLLAAPSARGLFHRAIAQSGAASNVATREQADETAAVLREALRVDPEAADVAQLLDAQNATIRRLRPLHHATPLRPHVDSDLLPTHPLDAAPATSSVPLIIGINRDEYRLYIRSSLKISDAELASYVERRLVELSVDEPSAVTRRVLEHYRALPADPRNPNAALLADIETELRFREPMLRYALARGRNTWLYQFDWPSPALRGWLGATHAIEIPFVFGNFDLPPIAKFVGAGTHATALSRQMMALWATFARDGRPPPVWRPFTANERVQLHLHHEIAYKRMDEDPTIALWDRILQR